MRIAIISDIHGNLTALEAVLQDLEQQPPVDQLVIAGDLCLNGPYPRESLQRVQSLDCPVIQGNTDMEIVTQAPDRHPIKARRNAPLLAGRANKLERVASITWRRCPFRIISPTRGAAIC